MPIVIHIDANNQQVRLARIPDKGSLPALQAMVGGSITIATRLPEDCVLFVDDEGLFKPQRWFFRLRGIDRPFAGNGVVVGPDRHDDEGEYIGSADVPARFLPALQDCIEFLDRAYIDAWVAATASEPEMAITNMDTGETEVIASRGQVWGDMPHPDDNQQNT